jgi:hypothetical protein
VCNALTPAGKTKKDLNPLNYMFAGACSGATYWTAFFPADTVKSRVQTNVALQSQPFSKIFIDIFRAEGMKGLYRGWSVTVMRAIPSNAFIFYTYEMCMSMIAEQRGKGSDNDARA